MIEEFARFKQRRGTTAEWSGVNEILMDGEVGIELTTTGQRRIKVGDGVTAWNSLAYYGYSDATVAASTDVLQKQAVSQAAQLVVDADPRTPTTNEKAALAGTGTPSASNKFVTNDDARIPTTDQKAALAGTGTPSASNKFVTDDDSRMSNSRTPTIHAATHSDGGVDPITVSNLAGNLTQARSHDSPDTDASASALHHTLGTGANQAAAGNHTHPTQLIVGTIWAYAGSSAPSGWLICDGSAVSRTTYADLFTLIGTTFGAGNGSTTFNIPNLKGKFPLGASTPTYPLAGTGGEADHTLTVDEMPSHRHEMDSRNVSSPFAATREPAFTYDSGGLYTSYVGGGLAHNNMPPYLALNYIIKV